MLSLCMSNINFFTRLKKSPIQTIIFETYFRKIYSLHTFLIDGIFCLIIFQDKRLYCRLLCEVLKNLLNAKTYKIYSIIQSVFPLKQMTQVQVKFL